MASSVIGAALWASATYAVVARRNRLGALAGHWYQVTFDPDDSGKVWSIEWVEVRHNKQTVTGTNWRIYQSHFDRRWKFSGRYQGSFLRAQYWADQGDGGDGYMKLFRYNRSGCLGRFEEDQPRTLQANPTFVAFAAPLEWIRVGGDDEPLILDKLRTLDRERLVAQLPRRIRRRLNDRLDEVPIGERVYRALSYGSAVADMSGPLALELERLRRQDKLGRRGDKTIVDDSDGS